MSHWKDGRKSGGVSISPGSAEARRSRVEHNEKRYTHGFSLGN
jgi:hypothetical protein